MRRGDGGLDQRCPNPSKTIGPDVARSIERAFDKPEGWLDQMHGGESSDIVTLKNIDALLARNALGQPGSTTAPVVQLSVTRDWLRLNLPGTVPDAISVHGVQDDAMAPAVVAGSIVLVDESVRRVLADGVYLLASRNAGPLMMRRVCRSVDGALHVTADAPGHPKTVLRPRGSEALSVRGRVVGAFAFRRV